MTRGQQAWAGVVATVALAGVLAAVPSLLGPAPDPAGRLHLAVCLLPGAVLLAASGVLVALAVDSRTALAGMSRPVGHPAGAAAPRPAVRVTAALLAVCLVAAGAVAAWLEWGPRYALAEVFPDPALAGCVAGEMGVADPSASVSRADLGQVLGLTCTGAGVESVAGLQLLTSLASLDLSSNRVSDLSPLTGLEHLGGVRLTDNRVADLSPLATLPVLGDLGLSGNAVTDLSPLARVGHLHALGLAGNEVDDLTPLAGLTTLTELDVSRNRVTDVTALAGLPHLDRLVLADNRVSDVSPLSSPALRVLDVSGNRVADLAPLSGCTGLGELWLGRNPLTDVAPLLALPALTGVDLEGVPSSTPGVAALQARGVYVGGFA